MRRACAILVILVAMPAVAQRLPRTVIPHHYDLTFTIDFPNDSFSGEALIDVTLQQPSRAVTLHALDLTFDEVSIAAAGGSSRGTAQINAADQTATLNFPETLPVGPARLRLRYHGNLNKQLRGLYLGQTDGRRKYAATQLQSTDARRAFPSFDEPEYKATFAITAVVDADDTAISNSRIVSDTAGPAGKKTVRFATTPRMSTYLVALVVGPFECLEGKAAGIPMRVCATADKLPLARLALSMSEKFTAYFNEYFGVPYPFDKLDHIGIPDFSAGAMENSGAVIYRDIFLLRDPATAPTQSLRGTANIISHEIAHMWFGDLVTMRWWDDLWLNEGFASWIASKPVEQAYPEWNVLLDDVYDMSGPMNADALRNTRPVKVDANTPAQIEELFDAITYGKASAIIAMVESFLGDETFRRGVSSYIRQHSYANATSDDFAAALSKAASNVPVDRILDTFVKQAGIPLITTETSCVNGRTIVKVRQRRFFIDARLMRTEPPELWHIPVCYRTAGKAETTCKLFSERTQVFRIDGCDAPVFFNARGNGYYLTALPDDELQRITSRVKDLTDAEQIALIRDEWLLVRGTKRPLPSYLQLSEAIFAASRNRAVIDELLYGLTSITDWLPENELTRYRAWLAAQTRPILNELGWDAAEGDSSDRRSLRGSILRALGIYARDPDTLAEMTGRAQRFLNDPRSIDPPLVAAILAGAAIHGDEELYEGVVRRLGQATALEERQQLQRMLSDFRDRSLMRRTLERALLPETRITEAGSYISRILRSREGRRLAWDFVTARAAEVEKKIQSVPYTGVVQAAGTFCDPAAQRQVRQFFTEHPFGAMERQLAQTLESIDLCIQTSRFQTPKLAQWFSQQEKQTSASTGGAR